MGDAEQKPRPPTRTQQAIVAALADPNLKTKRAVARAVGVAESSVYDALDNPRVKEELERLKLRRMDKARALKARALERALERIESPSIEDNAIGGYAKLGHEIEKDSPEQETRADPREIRDVIRRYAALGWRLACLRFAPQHVVLSPFHNRVRREKG